MRAFARRRIGALAFASLFVAACEQPSLAPTLDVTRAPLMNELPEDVTLVGGADFARFRGTPAFERLRECVQLDELVRVFQQRTGLSVDERTFDAMAIACGADGCALHAAGDFSRVTITDVVGATAFEVESGTWVTEAGSTTATGFDTRLPRGEPVSARLFDGRRFLAGDRAAVSAASIGSHRFTAARLAGAIPDGQVWFAAFDPARLFEQAADRLVANGAEPMLKAAELLRSDFGTPRVAAALADVMALSLDVEGMPALRLRVTCKGSAAAMAVSMQLHAALAAERMRSHPLITIDKLLARAVITRVGNVVEVSATIPPCEEVRSTRVLQP